MNKLQGILRTRPNVLCLQHAKLIRLFSTEVDEKIEIPKRIHRGPTDILRALESTINRDPTAAHYKYHDDPFLIPMSNIGKRTFSMAKESGRKAAQWIRDQHPELFQHKEADPPIKQFYPRNVYDEKSDVTEEDLKKAIQDALVSDAVLVHKLCKEKGIEISPETELSLLELLCYFNSSDTLPEDLIEERWFRQSGTTKEKVRKTWKDGSTAEEIFIGINNPGSEAYSAIIQGMAKYFQAERAWQLFQEAQEKNIPLNLNAYNGVIRIANFLKEDYEMRWAFVIDILSMMSKAKIKPNLTTLNSVLEIISTMGSSNANKANALKVLSEFRKIGIEPCLASWYYILITYCKERGPTSTILNDILKQLENKDLQIQDVRDTYFFVTAMDICRNQLFDKNLANRVHNLLLFGKNYDLIGDSFKESIYYRHYVSLLCQSDPIDQFMDTYYNLVPHIYVPEPSIMLEILTNLEANCAIEYLPKLWSDIIIFDHISREPILNKVLQIMVDNEPIENSDMKQNYSKIAWDIFEKINGQIETKTNKIAITGEMLGNALWVLLKCDEFEKASEVMEKLDEEQSSIAGVPKIQALSLYVDHCILQKVPSKAVSCIQYCSNCGFPETEALAAKLDKELTLDVTHLNALGKIVGHQVLRANEESKETNSPKAE